jgi:hypothetical protein
VACTVLKTSGRGDPLAEFNRVLRFGVLWRKRSLGTASTKGNHWVERILSHVQGGVVRGSEFCSGAPP